MKLQAAWSLLSRMGIHLSGALGPHLQAEDRDEMARKVIDRIECDTASAKLIAAVAAGSWEAVNGRLSRLYRTPSGQYFVDHKDFRGGSHLDLVNRTQAMTLYRRFDQHILDFE
jgi:hypothetical protein